MKRNSIGKKIAAAFMSGLSLFGGLTGQKARSAPIPQSIQQENKKESPAPVAPTSNKIEAPVIGGVETAGGWDRGIPPHIYGTFLVKRGTHKRTNKKR